MTPSGKAKESANGSDLGSRRTILWEQIDLTFWVSGEHGVRDEGQRVCRNGGKNRKSHGNAQEMDILGKAGIKQWQRRPPAGHHLTVERRRKSVRAAVHTSPTHKPGTKRAVSKECYTISLVFLLLHTRLENVHSTGNFRRHRFLAAFNVSLHPFSSDLNIFQWAWSPLVIKTNLKI